MYLVSSKSKTFYKKPQGGSLTLQFFLSSQLLLHYCAFIRVPNR